MPQQVGHFALMSDILYSFHTCAFVLVFVVSGISHDYRKRVQSVKQTHDHRKSSYGVSVAQTSRFIFRKKSFKNEILCLF